MPHGGNYPGQPMPQNFQQGGQPQLAPMQNFQGQNQLQQNYQNPQNQALINPNFPSGQNFPPQNFVNQQQLSQFPIPPPQNMQFPLQDLQKKIDEDVDVDDKSQHSSDGMENLEVLPPNHTIYVNNLNERVKVDDMRESLQEVFEEYGTIFQDLQSAIDAKEQMQGAKIYGKPMRINFARTKSDVIAKAEGTYIKREKANQLSLKEQIQKQREEKKRMELEKQEKQQLQQLQQQQTGSKQPPRPQIIPHNILFIENLSPAVTQEALMEIFLQCNGFKEVRLIQTKRVAFVEFEDEFQAGLAMNSLIGTQVLDCTLQISYAKK